MVPVILRNMLQVADGALDSNLDHEGLHCYHDADDDESVGQVNAGQFVYCDGEDGRYYYSHSSDRHQSLLGVVDGSVDNSHIPILRRIR